MQAWILEEQDQIEKKPLKLVDLPDRQPEASQIQIKVLFCGICRTDIHIVEGDLPLKKSPTILGHEVVGVVEKVAENASRFQVGDKVGVTWLNSTCRKCNHCLAGKENYCESFKATGWDQDGGFAEYLIISEEFAVSLTGLSLELSEIPPLLCPGVAGYAAYQLAEVQKGDKLGLIGFGPTANCVLKIAQSQGLESYVSTRSNRNVHRAIQQGATWVGNMAEIPFPCKLDAAIIFPPAGNLVESVLANVAEGGTVVLAPVSSSKITIEDYSNNFWGRNLKTLYHVNKSDIEDFITIVRQLGHEMRQSVRIFPFEGLQEALILVKNGKLDTPNAVIQVSH